jgi:RNA 3'-terminal phosphate cyclase-like protein
LHCAALTCARRALRSIDDIRLDDAAPGLRDYEASLLRLLEKVTNGTVVEINETGPRSLSRVCAACAACCCAALRCARCATAHVALRARRRHLRALTRLPAWCGRAGTRLRYTPGVIAGGGSLEHDCGTSRAIGYFLEPLVVLALFGKKARARSAAAQPPPRACTCGVRARSCACAHARNARSR